MSKVTKCDGCGEILVDAPAISGQRANGLGGAGLPDGEFDWCLTCAQLAFRAVANRQAPLAANLRQVKATPPVAIVKGQRFEAGPYSDCTHGADCKVHPGVNQIHNFDRAR